MTRVKGGVLVVAFVIATIVAPFIQTNTSYASQLLNRSLTLQGQGTDGGADPDVLAKHLFTFDLGSNHTTGGGLGSIKFQYCTTAGGTCTAPTGVDVSSATVGDNSTGDVQGFSMQSSPSGSSFYITRSLASASTGDTVIVRIDDVHNPSAANETFFVRITTYSGSTNATTGATDTGTVAASTAEPIIITGTMPESLIFCTGATVGLNGTSGLPDCATATSASNIQFNQLFSPTDTATATSQMAASTNAESGYAVTVNGSTMTSGANSITAITSGGGAASTKGSGQFGLNLKANTTSASNPAVGSEISPASDGTTLKGQAIGAYATADTFKFVTGDTIANAANGGSSGPTNAQIYTVSYIVNVPGSQRPGDYTTTLTYICTPTF